MSAMYGFTSLAVLAREQVSADYSRRSLVGQKLMISWARMSRGMHAIPHRHAHEQVFWILSGAVDFRLGDERRRCGPGDLVLVPPDVEHEVLCLEDTEFATMLAPPRLDLAPGEPLPAHLIMNEPDRGTT